MKVILYMTMSLNGMIAKSDDDTSWISQTEWKSYSAAVQTAGCLIVGRRTYDILTKQPEFVELKDIRIVVVSHGDFPVLSSLHSIARSPQEAVDVLKNFETIIVAGGGILNASFLQEQLIDEIYLDIEPIIFSKGIELFGEHDGETTLSLLGVKQLSPNEIQLHYRVLK